MGPRPPHRPPGSARPSGGIGRIVRRRRPAVGDVPRYEPHFSNLPGVVDEVEWDPALIAFRRNLDETFQRALRTAIGPLPEGPVRDVVPAMIAADATPSVASHMERHGTLDEFRRFVVHRSPDQLKGADGHTFAIPRLTGTPNQLLARIQAGEDTSPCSR